MDSNQALAEYLTHCRETGTSIEVAEHERLLNVAQGYVVQDTRHRALGLEDRVGYKIGCTTSVMQRFLKIDHPCAGSIRRDDVHSSGVRIETRRLVRGAVECEIAVRMGATPLSLDRDGLLAAIATVMPCIELVDDRYGDFESLGVPTLIADDFFHVGLVTGPETVFSPGLDLASLDGRLQVNDTLFGKGRGSDILGDPVNALAWLGSLLARTGSGLRAGDIVSLGSVVETYWTSPEDHVTVSFDELGEVSCSFA